MGVAYAFCSGLSETYTGLFSIREFDTGSLKSALNRLNSPFFQLIAPLEPCDRVDRYFCRLSKLSNTEAEGRSCHSTLNRQKNHHDVPILVDSTDYPHYRYGVLISVSESWQTLG